MTYLKGVDLIPGRLVILNDSGLKVTRFPGKATKLYVNRTVFNERGGRGEGDSAKTRGGGGGGGKKKW